MFVTRKYIPRRTFLHLAAGAAALPVASRVAIAQTYPSRPVRIIVGFSAAGASDIAARLIAQWLTERMGQQFVVENRPGAAGVIGSKAVIASPADGATLLYTPSSLSLSVAINNLRGLYATEYGLIMSGTLVSIAPVMCLFLLLQREFISGLTSGAVKG